MEDIPKSVKVFLWIVLILGAIGVFIASTGLNTVIDKNVHVQATKADIDVAYQRRSDMTPQLIKVVEGAANYERGTLDRVIQARAAATKVTLSEEDLRDPEKVKAFTKAQNELGASLRGLFALAENYPQLKATEAFRDLQTQIEGSENRIAVARHNYNVAVEDFNAFIRRFPTSWGASWRGLNQPYVMFEATPGAETPPTISFEVK